MDDQSAIQPTQPSQDTQQPVARDLAAIPVTQQPTPVNQPQQQPIDQTRNLSATPSESNSQVATAQQDQQQQSDLSAFAADAQKSSEQNNTDLASFTQDISAHINKPEVQEQLAAEQKPIQQQAEFDSYKATMNDQDKQAFDALIKLSPNNARAMMEVGKTVDALGGAAKDLFTGVSNIGASINNDVINLVTSKVPLYDASAKEQISSDLSQFRNSKTYKENAASFYNLANDIIKPFATAFAQSAYMDQLRTTFENIPPPVDENGVSIENPIEVMMNAGATPIQVAFSVLGFSPLAQQIGERAGMSKEDAINFGQQVAQIGMVVGGGSFIKTPEKITRLNDASATGTEQKYFSEPLRTQPDEAEARMNIIGMIAPDHEVPPINVERGAPQTIHDVARQINPEVFSKWDPITAQLQRLHTWIGDLAQKRDDNILSDPEVVAAKGKVDDLTNTNNEQINSILDKVHGVEDKLTNKQSEKLADLRSQIDQSKTAFDDFLADKKMADTPDMEAVRNRIIDLSKKREGLADDVNKAYRDAADKFPETKTVPEPQFNFSKENVEAHLGDVIGEKPNQEQTSKEQMRNSVIGDIVSKQIAAGRSLEEAQTTAHITATFLQSMSDIYGGTKGTIADWYKNEGADVIKQGERVAQLAQKGSLEQKAKGSYIPAYISNTGRAIIRLMKRADASTFIHESAHHFLDIMAKYAAEEGAPKQLVDDVAKIREWLGKSKGNWSGFTRSQHESFARGVERYFLEGHAPNEAMADIFAKLKKMLTDIYKSVTNIPDQKVEINDDIRKLFDRMLGGGDETIIAKEHTTGKEFADLHEADAKETEPKDAAAVADNINAERQKLKEQNNVTTTENATSPAGIGEPATTGSAAEPSATEGRITEQSGEVGASGVKTPAEGDGLRPEPRAVDRGATSEPGRNAAVSATTAEERAAAGTTHPTGGKPYFLDESSKRFRLDKINGTEDAMAALNELVANNSDIMDARYGEPAYRQAKLIDANFELIEQLAEKSATLKKDAQNSPQDMLEYLRITQQLQIAAEIRAELQSDWGHAGHALRRVVGSQNIPDLASYVKSVTGKSLLQLEEEAKLMDTISKPEAKADFAVDVRKGRYQAFEDATLAFYRNDILSNPLTHLAYLSNTFVKAYGRILINTPYAAMIGAIRNDEERVTLAQIPHMLTVVNNAAMNAFPAAWGAVKSGIPFMRGSEEGVARKALDKVFADRFSGRNDLLKAARVEAKANKFKQSDIDATLALRSADKESAAKQQASYPAIHAYLLSEIDKSNKGYKQSLPGDIGHFLTVPERSIAGIHTLSYSVNYEMRIAEKAFQDGVSKGLTGDAMNEHLVKYTQSPPMDVMKDAHEKSLQAMYMKTSSQEMNRMLSSIANPNIPGLRLVTGLAMPFAKIGVNMLDQGLIESTPLGILKKSVRDDLLGKNGDIARANAGAKMMLGATAGTAAFGMAMAGFITGGGSTDYKRRAIDIAGGWKPYSIKIGNLYIPYKKWLGEMSPIVGGCADLADGIHSLSEGDTHHIAMGIAASFAENITSDTWLNGMSQLVEAFRNQDSGWRYAQNLATGFIPYSAALNMVRQQVDPTARSTTSNGINNLYGLAPKIANRIPFVSYMLDPKVNVLGGELPSGTNMGLAWDKNDPIVQKLDKLDIGISTVPKEIMGVNLTPDQYHEYAVVSGLTLRHMLWNQEKTGLLQQPDFEKLSHYDQSREIDRTVTSSRNAGAGYLTSKNPEIMEKAADIKERLHNNP